MGKTANFWDEDLFDPKVRNPAVRALDPVHIPTIGGMKARSRTLQHRSP